MTADDNNNDDMQHMHDPTDNTIYHALVEGHAPQESDVKFSIGTYKNIDTIERGDGRGLSRLRYNLRTKNSPQTYQKRPSRLQTNQQPLS